MLEDLTVAGAFLKMLKGCYRTVVSVPLRCFTWGFYPNSPKVCGAFTIMLHPVRSFCIFSLSLFAFAYCLTAFCLVAFLPRCLVAFSCSETGKTPVYYSSEQLR
jgi:hypothetical protein